MLFIHHGSCEMCNLGVISTSRRQVNYMYVGKPLQYYSNMCATFCVSLLLVSEDVQPQLMITRRMKVFQFLSYPVNQGRIIYTTDKLHQFACSHHLPCSDWSRIYSLGLGSNPHTTGGRWVPRLRERCKHVSHHYHHILCFSPSCHLVATVASA